MADKSRDDFHCLCYKIKEGLGCFSNRCVTALVGADNEQRRQPLQTPGEHVIPPDEQFWDPSSKRSRIITESGCSVEGLAPEPAASSTVAVANKSNQGFYHYIGNDESYKRLDYFVDDGDDDGPDHGLVDPSSDDNDDEATAVRSMTTIRTARSLASSSNNHIRIRIGSGPNIPRSAPQQCRTNCWESQGLLTPRNT